MVICTVVQGDWCTLVKCDCCCVVQVLADQVNVFWTVCKKKPNCVYNIHMYGCPAMRHLDMTEVVAFSRLYGYYPNQCTYKIYNRFAVNVLYMSSVDYKQTNKHSDDTVLLTNDDFFVIFRCAVGKYFCECKTACNCKEKVLLFVNKIEPPGDVPLFSNRNLHITSNSFLYGGSRNFETVCCEPTEVARTCFRYQQNEKNVCCSTTNNTRIG